LGLGFSDQDETGSFLIRPTRGKADGATEGYPDRALSGCKHLERVRTITHYVGTGSVTLPAEARAAYIAGTDATKDQLEAIVAALPHCSRWTLQRLWGGIGDCNVLALLAGQLHENLRDCGRLTGELQQGPLLNVQNNSPMEPPL
jgi:hypothetical protein